MSRRTEIDNLMEVLKDKDVKAESLLIKVYDTESGKEGWISFAQIIRIVEEAFKSRFGENKPYNKD